MTAASALPDAARRMARRSEGAAWAGVSATVAGAACGALAVTTAARPIVGAAIASALALVVIARRAARLAAGLAASLVAIAAIVPYPVSFVGKTPFGVVSAMGAVGAVSVVAVLVAAHRDGDAPLRLDGVVLGMAGWWMVVFASAVTAGPLAKHGLNTARMLLIAMPGAYLVGRALGQRSREAMRLALVAVVIVSLLAVLERLFLLSPYRWLPDIAWPLGEPGTTYRYGTVRVRLGSYHASGLSRLLAIAYPILVVQRRHWPGDVMLRIGLVSVPVALLLTQTFQAWVATVAALLVVFMFSRLSLRAVLIAATAILVVFTTGLAAPATRLVLTRVAPQGSDAEEAAFRLALLPAAAQHASRADVLGSGPGSFNFVALEGDIGGRRQRLVDDSTFAAQLVEVGYPGAVTLVMMVVAAAGWLLSGRRDMGRLGALAGLVAWLALAIAVDMLADDQSVFPVWLLIGLSVGTARR